MDRRSRSKARQMRRYVDSGDVGVGVGGGWDVERSWGLQETLKC